MNVEASNVAALAKYGPWALILGGSEGVGAAFAEQLADAGLNLFLVARKLEPLEATAERCRARGVTVRTAALDLTSPDSVTIIIDACSDIEVGVLVYNAGADSNAGGYIDQDPAHIARLVALNVTTPLALIRHFARPMRERRSGGILLIGSLAGDLGSANHAVYGGVKAFTRVFAEGLWLELRDEGVDVLCLVLGVTRTPAMERVGLSFDLPGVPISDPADVARQGLENLAHGPVQVAHGNESGAAFRADPDRTKVVLAMHRASQRLFARKG